MSASKILIHGVEIRDPNRSNRGAEQLLRSAAHRVSEWGCEPVVTVGKVCEQVRSELGLKQYVGNPRLGSVEKLLPKFDFRGFSSARSLTGVLDVSGFVLGDAWGPVTAAWLEKKFRIWSSVGAPVVLLPQAFGPFSSGEMVASARAALDACSLAYARDDKSLRYLEQLDSTVRPASCVDITLGVTSGRRGATTNEFVIVPNWNLTRVVGRDQYVETLAEAARWGASKGMSVVGLLHEGSEDLRLLEAVSERASLQVVADCSGWQVKDRLADARLVLSGRYHAMLGSLSTGTPVAVHSWSHKYKAALEAFGAADWQCDPSSAEGTIAVLETLDSSDVSEHLLARGSVLAKEVDEMWLDVAGVFGL